MSYDEGPFQKFKDIAFKKPLAPTGIYGQVFDLDQGCGIDQTPWITYFNHLLSELPNGGHVALHGLTSGMVIDFTDGWTINVGYMRSDGQSAKLFDDPTTNASYVFGYNKFIDGVHCQGIYIPGWILNESVEIWA